MKGKKNISAALHIPIAIPQGYPLGKPGALRSVLEKIMFDQKIIENLGELLQMNRFSQNYMCLAH